MRFAVLALAFLFGAGNALALPAAEADSAAALVDRLVIDRAAAIAAEQGRIEERQASLILAVAERGRRLRTAISSLRADSEAAAQMQAQIRQVSGDMNVLIDDTGRSNSRFAAEMDEYRSQVTSLASSPDPRRREALRRYADGDRAGGLAALVAIQEAETAAVAAGWAELGALAQDMRDRGEKSTADVIAIYQTVVRLDPRNVGAWVALSTLQNDAGQAEQALTAAQQGVNAAGSDYAKRAEAEEAMARAQLQSGRGDAADTTLTAAFHANDSLTPMATRDRDERIARGHEDFGRYGAVSPADHAGAIRHYLTAVAVRRRILAAAASTANVSSLANSLLNLAYVEASVGLVRRAEESAGEALEIRRRLLADDPNSWVRQLHVAAALLARAAVLKAEERSDDEVAALNEAVGLLRQLQAQASENFAIADLLASALAQLGANQALSAHSETARAAFTEAVALRRQAAAASSQRARTRLLLAFALMDLARMQGEHANWIEAGRIFADLNSQLLATHEMVGIRVEIEANAGLAGRVSEQLARARAAPGDLEVQLDAASRLLHMNAQFDSGTQMKSWARIECLRRAYALAPDRVRSNLISALQLYGRIGSYRLLRIWQSQPHWDAGGRRQALLDAAALRQGGSAGVTLDLADDDMRMGHWQDARQRAQDALDAMRASASDPSDALDHLGEAALGAGDAPAAVRAYTEYVALARAYQAATATDPYAPSRVADALSYLSAAQRAAGENSGAVVSSQQEVSLRRQIFEAALAAHEDTTLLAEDLCGAYVDLGHAQRALNASAAAASAYQACLALGHTYPLSPYGGFSWRQVEALEGLGMLRNLPNAQIYARDAHTMALAVLNDPGEYGPPALLDRLFPADSLNGYAAPELGSDANPLDVLIFNQLLLPPELARYAAPNPNLPH